MSDKFMKFIRSGSGIFSIVCLVAAVPFTKSVDELFGTVMFDLILFSVLYPALLILESSNKRRGIIFASVYISIAMVIMLLMAFKLNFSIRTDSHSKVVMSLLLVHLFGLCSAGLYKGIKRYQNRGLYSERKTTETVGTWNDEYDITTASSIAEGFCDMLEKRGLQRFLMRDFTTSTFLSYGDFDDRNITHKKLQGLLLDILRFLELPDVVALVIEYVSDSGTNKTQVGSYSRESQVRTITVKIMDYYGPNNAVAILCHECTHYFMEYNRLNWKDTDLNEQRTDIVANLIGFNRIMIDGYRTIETVKVSGNIQTTTTHKIGYIDVKDCEDLGRFLEHRRKGLRAKQKAEQEFSEIRQKFMQHLDTAKTLVFQLEHIDFTRMNNASPEHVAKIQAVLMEKETRNIPAELNRFERCLAGNPDMPKLDNEAEALSRLCTDLVLWLQVLQGR